MSALHDSKWRTWPRACLQGKRVYPCARVTLATKRVQVSSGFQANFTGRVTLSARSTLPALLTCFVMRDIVWQKTLDKKLDTWQKNLTFSMENTLNSRQNGKILSSYTENTLYRSDVYNLAQKLEKSVQIVKMTGHAWRRKVVPGRRVIPSRAFTRHVG